MPPTPTDEPGLVAAGRIDCLDEDDDRCLGALVAALVFDASIDQAAEKTAKHAQLAKAGIVPRETA